MAANLSMVFQLLLDLLHEQLDTARSIRRFDGNEQRQQTILCEQKEQERKYTVSTSTTDRPMHSENIMT